MCHQTVGLIQREVEKQGIPTVGVSVAREVSEQVKPPRTYYLRYPFGHPFGKPGDRAEQRQIMLDLLALLEQATLPGILVESPYRWKRTRFPLAAEVNENSF